jgi:aspartate racemase
MTYIPRKRLIGVLGGMGPAATVDFMNKVIATTPAQVDQDHVPLIVYQVPQIPSRTAAIAAHDDAPLPEMIAGLRILEQAGAEIIAIPCNTAHHWYEPLARATTLEIIHIADAVRSALTKRGEGSRSVGIMATRATLQSKIFERRLSDVRFMAPSEHVQILIDKAIAAVKAADLPAARSSAAEAASAFVGAGAGTLLLACTELPIAMKGERDMPCVDSTEALARACVAASLGTDTR